MPTLPAAPLAHLLRPRPPAPTPTAAVAPRAVATGADKAKEVAADAVSDAGAALQAKAQQLADYAVVSGGVWGGLLQSGSVAAKPVRSFATRHPVPCCITPLSIRACCPAVAHAPPPRRPSGRPATTSPRLWRPAPPASWACTSPPACSTREAGAAEGQLVAAGAWGPPWRSPHALSASRAHAPTRGSPVCPCTASTTCPSSTSYLSCWAWACRPGSPTGALRGGRPLDCLLASHRWRLRQLPWWSSCCLLASCPTVAAAVQP